MQKVLCGLPREPWSNKCHILRLAFLRLKELRDQSLQLLVPVGIY